MGPRCGDGGGANMAAEAASGAEDATTASSNGERKPDGRPGEELAKRAADAVGDVVTSTSAGCGESWNGRDCVPGESEAGRGRGGGEGSLSGYSGGETGRALLLPLATLSADVTIAGVDDGGDVFGTNENGVRTIEASSSAHSPVALDLRSRVLGVGAAAGVTGPKGGL